MTAKPRLLVLTSTYPRRSGDDGPAFVHELCRLLLPHCDVLVLAPHAAGIATREVLDGVAVRRYRYLPERWETLAYDGGIPEKLRRERWRLLQVPFLVAGLVLATLDEVVRGGRHLIHAHWLLPQGLIAGLARGAG